MFQGKRNPQADYFDDFLTDDPGGVFEGGALSGFESVKERIEPDGVHVKLDCRYCGGPAEVTFSWEDMFVVGSNGPRLPPVFPQGWGYSPNNQDAYFQARCTRCGNPGFAVHYRPDEARKLVNAAVQRGYISPAQIDQWKVQVAHARGM